MQRGRDNAETLSSVLATVLGLFGVLAVWAGRTTPGRNCSSAAQLDEAADALARLVGRQWEEEAVLRQLFDPAPLPVAWASCPRVGMADHRPLIGGPVSCRADTPQVLAAAFRGLPRRRLVVLGPAGSGKTTFAVLLTLALLRDRREGEPVPVLCSLASFDPARESVRQWLVRRIIADYPALADTQTYGASAIEDLVGAHRVLPVLDGLDELPAPAVGSVLAALGGTLDAHAPLVVTCRTAAYAAAVSSCGVLAGAAVVEPSPLRAHEAVAVLRLAAPPGARQRAWDALAAHVDRHPGGPAAQTLTNPLMVALARSVYADAAGDPGELADRERFATSAEIEHHLLDALVPTLYARAHQRDPVGRRHWTPGRAHRHLVHLASGLHRRAMYDLAWWQFYQWLPSRGRPWRRAAVWSLGVIVLCLLVDTGQRMAVRDPEWTFADAVAIAGLNAAAMFVMQFVGASLVGRHSRQPANLVGNLVVTAVTGGLVFTVLAAAVGVVKVGYGTHGVARLLVYASTLIFMFLVVMQSTGLPVPPRMPSRGNLTVQHWRQRLPRAVATVLGVAALATAGLNIYVLVDTSDWSRTATAWAYGPAVGALVGMGPAVLQWVRGTATVRDLTTVEISLRSDRVVALVHGIVAGLLMALSDFTIEVVDRTITASPTESALEPISSSQLELPLVAICGFMLALMAHAWPQYTAARALLALQGMLPWRLQPFLADAHRLGILRQVGALYQFRHARLQHHLAVRTPRPFRE
ncbi:NACHT domain-containing protein [Streptomyces triculaminicus]|uniref:NACHT domain-containing protein n=1 Tax=Streptomyces triculaminicus TaxID=2816232 RepID=UPI0033EA9675